MSSYFSIFSIKCLTIDSSNEATLSNSLIAVSFDDIEDFVKKVDILYNDKKYDWRFIMDKFARFRYQPCIPLGEDRYVCDLTYTAQTSKYTGVTTDVTNTKIILIRSGKKLLAESMQNY